MKLTPAAEITKQKGVEYLFVSPISHYIWVRRYKKGMTPPQLERSLDTKDWAIAKLRRDDLFKRWLGGSLEKIEKKSIRLCNELWTDFENGHQHYRKNSYLACIYSGKRLMDYFGSKYPYEINDAEWEGYQGHRKKKKGPKVSFSNDRKWLKKFVRHLRSQVPCLYVDHKGEKLDLPNLKDPNPKRKGQGPGRNLDDIEIKKILEKAPTEDLRTQILMGFTMFMRSSEILLLTWNRVNFQKRLIILTEDDTKTKDPREVNMTEEVYQRLFEMHGKRKGSAVFAGRFDPNTTLSRQGNKNDWDKCREDAGVNCRFHDLRHSGLTRAFKATNQWAQICHMAGLSLEEAERTYLHITSDDTKFCANLVSVPGTIAEAKPANGAQMAEVVQ